MLFSDRFANIGKVKRSAGQSVVNSAAYRAGEKLYSDYYGEVSDYTHKGGAICSEILPPPRAPDREPDGIPNPHHVLCPIRPLKADGTWDAKQRRVYRLDDHGERICGKNGKPLFDAAPMTDWGKPETLQR